MFIVSGILIRPRVLWGLNKLEFIKGCIASLFCVYNICVVEINLMGFWLIAADLSD